MSDDCAIISSSDDCASRSSSDEREPDWDDLEGGEWQSAPLPQINFKRQPIPIEPLQQIKFKRQSIPQARQLIALSAPPPAQDFRYSPLDYRAPSIRLLRLRPEKSCDGLVQCDLRHAMISDKYSCLSYVWGDETRGKWIILDGQRFWVRRNLYDFLTYARRKPQLRAKWLWVDALSIDQSTIAERNHQVQQMGQIYSGAKEVVSWLGCDEDISKFLRNASRQERCPKGFSAFCYSQYWDRAWITQEIVLARRVKFMAKDSSLGGVLIPFTNEQICQLRIENLHPQTVHQLRGRSLIYLLDKFRLKKSGNLRDRIFSLLALCGDGSSLVVDYDVTLPALAQNVLRTCRASFCLCSVATVGNVLGISSHISGSENHNENPPSPFALIKLPDESFRLGQKLFYSRPCRDVRCDGTDWSHFYFVDKQTREQTVFSVTVDLQYFCSTYRGLVIFFVNAELEVIDFRDELLYSTETHCIPTDFGQELLIIRIPFNILLQVARLHQFSDRCCRRVASLGTSTVVDSSGFLEMSVLDTAA